METSKTQVKKDGTAKKWKDMAGIEKPVFVLKVVIMVCSGGLIFGNVL
jgi:hypothetical protein